MPTAENVKVKRTIAVKLSPDDRESYQKQVFSHSFNIDKVVDGIDRLLLTLGKRMEEIRTELRELSRYRNALVTGFTSREVECEQVFIKETCAETGKELIYVEVRTPDGSTVDRRLAIDVDLQQDLPL